MSPIDWATRPLKKYAEFSGRAPRAEFWWYVLLVCAASVVALVIEKMLGLSKLAGPYGPLTLVLGLATFIPGLAVQFRRLHDTNRSAWWLLLFWVPYAFYMYSTMTMLEKMAVDATPDMQSAGSFLLLSLVVLVVAIVLIIFFAMQGTRGPNKYGEDPYAGGAPPA